MPAVFQQLQELDDKRIKQIQNYTRKGVEIERSVFPIINKCLDGIIRAADSVDPEKACVLCRLLTSLHLKQIFPHDLINYNYLFIVFNRIRGW